MYRRVWGLPMEGSVLAGEGAAKGSRGACHVQQKGAPGKGPAGGPGGQGNSVGVRRVQQSQLADERASVGTATHVASGGSGRRALGAVPPLPSSQAVSRVGGARWMGGGEVVRRCRSGRARVRGYRVGRAPSGGKKAPPCVAAAASGLPSSVCCQGKVRRLAVGRRRRDLARPQGRRLSRRVARWRGQHGGSRGRRQRRSGGGGGARACRLCCSNLIHEVRKGGGAAGLPLERQLS